MFNKYFYYFNAFLNVYNGLLITFLFQQFQHEMEQITLSQTHAFSSTGSVASGSSDSPASALTCIDDKLIADEVLGVWQGHRKIVR